MSKRNFATTLITLALCALTVLIVRARSGPARHEHDAPRIEPRSDPPRLTEMASPSAVQTAALSRAPSTVAQPATLPSQVAPSTPTALSEEQLMEDLRHARTSVLAIRLARLGNEQFPDSDFAPERESILIHSLADIGQTSEARGEAETMVNHYPDSNWVREIERFTGAHRHRNVRLNDAGELEYH